MNDMIYSMFSCDVMHDGHEGGRHDKYRYFNKLELYWLTNSLLPVEL